MSTGLTTKDKFGHALQTLEVAKPFAKSMYQTEVFQLATELSSTEEGMVQLYEFAPQFDQAGVFHGGPWVDASNLEAPFVGGSLKLKGINSVVEMLSELRMLAIAEGTYQHPEVPKEEAATFLNEVLALNLDLLFPPETEEARVAGGGEHLERGERLFRFLGGKLSYKAVADKLVEEIERLTVQRPIMVDRIVLMIETATRMIDENISDSTKDRLLYFKKAITYPTALSEQYTDLKSYRQRLMKESEESLLEEAQIFAKSMNETGLVSPANAVFVHYLNRKYPHLLSEALSLTEQGKASLNANPELIRDMIQISVHPQTSKVVYGLSKMLDRGVLTQEPLLPALRRLFEIDIQPEVKKLLMRPEFRKGGITANGILVGGVISVLGQPLGIGQGLNPTCQSARALSLWSQHGIGQLLEYIARAVRENDIDMTFEGEPIHSNMVIGGVAEEIHQDLDPVSIVLVPHLDKIYNEMMKKTIFRGEDGHKWVNPEFYGEWISRGFANIIDPLTGYVADYAAFVRLFYATHHPEYNEGYEMIYPNPVGIYITNVHGNLLGLHAVSIQRIAEDPNGEYRVYFYNPNNDSGQNWGQGILTSVQGNGEYEGESSLPFHQFTSRMYAFHYNPYEQGDLIMVEDSDVEKIETLARESWGKNYTWF
ncbi:hypothetical protein A1A1_09916 [Planococcus antarcticus DSM 14505]|uniref:Uncharacterized protein n=1 Tax=Planococcus antarcticus DSM 14505 TaxID=1185653 RepID=A0AA87LR94_9BACL|nr:hypothetical protein [Planococcus antarcticus]EIM06853.1 hypothetical protein A1A1_09916 [Planococcus antarcticus DSM 14505]